jgi:hypothetical protein
MMRKQANVSEIIQNALKAANGSVEAYNTEKRASITNGYAVPLAVELQKVAELIRSLPRTPDVSVEDVEKFAQVLRGYK